MRGRIVILALLVAVLAGCGPKLQAVRDFSTISMTALEQSQDSISYLSEACEKTQHTLIPLKEPSKEKAQINFEVSQKCATHISAVEGTKAAIAIFTEYFRALAMLSSDALYKHDGKIYELRTKLKSATDSSGQLIFSGKEAKVDAVFSIADSLIQLGTQAYQKYKLKEYIQHSYPIVENGLKQLENLIGKSCVDELDNQKSIIRQAYYTAPKKALYDKMNNKKIKMSEGEYEAVKLLLESEYKEQVTGTISAIEMCKKTAASLAQARTVFEDINAHLDELDSSYIRAIVDIYYSEVRSNLQTLNLIKQ